MNKQKKDKICNICGNNKFVEGPGGRLSYDKITPPRCTSCDSLERHRAFRSIFDQLWNDSFKRYKALQFSEDVTATPEWFGEYEVSIYGSNNSLDLQDINKSSDFYDVVICNHVLEHVENDEAALSELARIIKPTGFIFLSVPDPYRRKTTEDWGYPKTDQHGHYRLYGKDFQNKLKGTLTDSIIYSCIGIDPVTFSKDIAFLICFSAEREETIRNIHSSQKI